MILEIPYPFCINGIIYFLMFKLFVVPNYVIIKKKPVGEQMAKAKRLKNHMYN